MTGSTSESDPIMRNARTSKGSAGLATYGTVLAAFTSESDPIIPSF